ncbi:MAG: potassium channel family protein [Coriobacteriia bacterium]|nr:potassium channel family protein [Coriobacteriia bacterium]
MHKIQLMGKVLRAAGAGPMTCLFVIVFILCSIAVWLSDPVANSLTDGMWFSFQAVSTIGFGDVVAGGPIARIVTVILSIVSIFYIALITGVVVSYCTESLKRRQRDSFEAAFDKLEHLEELSPEELTELSRKIRSYRGQ